MPGQKNIELKGKGLGSCSRSTTFLYAIPLSVKWKAQYLSHRPEVIVARSQLEL